MEPTIFTFANLNRKWPQKSLHHRLNLIDNHIEKFSLWMPACIGTVRGGVTTFDTEVPAKCDQSEIAKNK